MEPIMDSMLYHCIVDQVTHLEKSLSQCSPLLIAGGGMLAGWLAHWLCRNLSAAGLVKLARALPGVEGVIQGQIDSQLATLRQDLKAQLKGRDYNTQLPVSGWPAARIQQEIQDLLDISEFKTDTGALSGICHRPEDTHTVDVITRAYTATAYTNPLNPDAYPGLRKMEAEVVRITGELFHAGEEMRGTMTSGGTESLMLAVLAYRGYGLQQRSISKPNIVIPVTGHVAFDKAGHILGVEVRHVPVDSNTLVPSMADFRKLIDRDTIALVASAPQYPHGVMDPIEAIASLGLELGIPVHVDACLGGFLLAFAEQAGWSVPAFDFAVPGVTSLSADTHKFGYAPKGSSVIMYSRAEYIHHQYYVAPDWTGGIFISPTLAGSRSGGIVAATWASLMYHGQDGYTKATRQILETAATIRNGIAGISGLRILGDPFLCIIAFSSDEFHIYQLADEMKASGWLLSCLQYPTAVHLYVVPSHTKPGIAQRFLGDLRDAVEKVRANPGPLTGRAAVYGMAQKIPDRSLVASLGSRFLDALYSTRG